MNSPEKRRERGVSLLEMMVAIAILAVALGAMYQAVSRATTMVRVDEKYAYAVELARTLVALNQSAVPGMTSTGETEGGFIWELETTPLSLSLDEINGLSKDALVGLTVRVSWQSALQRRQVQLDTVVEGMVDE